jgi:hypothetical protein
MFLKKEVAGKKKTHYSCFVFDLVFAHGPAIRIKVLVAFLITFKQSLV